MQISEHSAGNSSDKEQEYKAALNYPKSESKKPLNKFDEEPETVLAGLLQLQGSEQSLKFDKPVRFDMNFDEKS